MPLKFTDHSKAPQLEEELRNLYRQVDRLTAGSGTAIIIPGDGGGGGDGDIDPNDHGGQVGTVFSWHLRAEFYYDIDEMPADGQEYIFDLPIPKIKKPYTHLELHAAVLQAVGLDASFDWIIRGNERYYLWDRYHPSFPHTGSWHLETLPAVHYRLDGSYGATHRVPFEVGRYTFEPHYDNAIMANGDLAFTPIFPVRLVNSSYEWEELKAVATVRIGAGHKGGLCYKVWFVGRYMLRDDNEPSENVCFWQT